MNLPVLTGPRLRMVALALDEFDSFAKVAMDQSHWRYSPNVMTTLEHLRAWVEASIAAPNRGAWVTMLGDEIVGSSSLLDFDTQHRTVEIGSTWLVEKYRGSGLNTEAKLLQLTYCFEVLGLRRVAFKIHHENQRSQAAVRKLGAVYEGTFRNHYLMPDGSTRNSVWFSIVAEEWAEVKARLSATVDASLRQ